MNQKLYFPFLVLLLFFSVNVFAQKTVVIMGSSTAVGSGASVYDSAWAGRLQALYNQNTGDGTDTSFYNIAMGGYNSYLEMPSDFIPPAGRPAPDPLANVTKALSYDPDIVFINLPSNDVAEGFSKLEYMDNLRLMYSTIIGTGAKCYVTTPQPRNDFTVEERQLLFDLVDSVFINFGLHSINFWDTIVTKDGTNSIKEDVRFPGTDFHVNDLGHFYLFQQIVAKNVFAPDGGPLPVRLTAFQAQLKNNSVLVKWHIDLQDANTTFELQRSADGHNFETIYSLHEVESRQSGDYVATDLHPLATKGFYRLKITTPGKSSYSGIISVSRKQANLDIIALYKDNTANLVADLTVQKKQVLSVNIISISGAVVLQRKEYIDGPSAKLILPISHLAAGQYYFSVRGEDGNNVVRAFIK